MRIAIVTADIVCLIVMLILLQGTLSNVTRRERLFKIYILNVITEVVALVMDIACYLMEGRVAVAGLLATVNILSYVMADVLLITFGIYLTAIIREKQNLPAWVISIGVVITVGDMIKSFVGLYNGKLFRVENARFVNGPWEPYVGLLPAVAICYFYAVIIFYHKVLGRKQAIVLSSYMTLPLLSALLQLVYEEIHFSYVMAALALLVIYVVIHAQAIAEADIRAKILSEVSYLDSLTGLKNRRAYEDIIQKFMAGDEVGTIFCDINSLKYVNDNIGHEAGDQLIIRFANLLKESFPDGDLCRISGDEFVVVLYGITQEQMDARMKAFREVIVKNGQIAAVGYVHERNHELLNMVNEAEQLMYKDKARYYEERL